MRAKQLIEKLKKIKGNPEIYLWNGIVQDYIKLDSSLIEDKLYKVSKEHIFQGLRMEFARTNQKFDLDPSEESFLKTRVDNIYKKASFGPANMFVDNKDLNKWYSRSKNILVLQQENADKEYFDRIGTISY